MEYPSRTFSVKHRYLSKIAHTSAHTAAIILRLPMSPYRSIFLDESKNRWFLPKSAGNVAYILEKERR